jgi:type II secretory pathway pseudopilin PulG
MAALLVALNVMAVVLTVALPTWRTMIKREKEAELIWRGQQYARAVGLFQRKYANTFPPNLDILLNERFLRKKYKDPMTKDGEFQLLYAASQNAPGQPQGPGQSQTPGQSQMPGSQKPGQVPQRGQAGTQPSPLDVGSQGPAGARGGIMGVASKSTETSMREYNGRTKYNEWAFVWQAASTRPGAPAGSSQTPGMPGGTQKPGMPQPGGKGPGTQPQPKGNNPFGPFGNPGGPGVGSPRLPR